MFKKILLTFIAILISLLLAEFAFRMAGLKPHLNRDYSFRSVPRNGYIPDSLLGSRLGEGSFKAIINNKLIYNTNHVLTGYDVTRKIYDTPPDAGLPRIDFHGCSFTYGMGVNDTQTHPSLFAASHRGYQVRNYGCPGYSTLEALLILKQQKNKRDLPECVIINYLDFHDERNAGTSNWREGLKEGFLVGAKNCLSENLINKMYLCRFPFGKLADNNLEIKWYGLNNLYYQFWGRNISALVYTLEKAVNRLLYDETSPSQITKAILLEIKRICDENKVNLIITTMSRGDKTQDIQHFLDENHISRIDISVDFSNPVYTNLPYDGHPSPLAHRLFAEKLASAKMNL